MNEQQDKNEYIKNEHEKQNDVNKAAQQTVVVAYSKVAKLIALTWIVAFTGMLIVGFVYEWKYAWIPLLIIPFIKLFILIKFRVPGWYIVHWLAWSLAVIAYIALLFYWGLGDGNALWGLLIFTIPMLISFLALGFAGMPWMMIWPGFTMVLTIGLYFGNGKLNDTWHPSWLIFLLIPIVSVICAPAYTNKK